MTVLVFAYLGLAHVLLLLRKPALGVHDVLKAGPAHDVEGDEHHVCARVGQWPHIFVFLLASSVTYPGGEKLLKETRPGVDKVKPRKVFSAPDRL